MFILILNKYFFAIRQTYPPFPMVTNPSLHNDNVCECIIGRTDIIQMKTNASPSVCVPRTHICKCATLFQTNDPL